MKKLEVVVKNDTARLLRTTLMDLGVTGMMFTNVMGAGSRKAYTQIYRGKGYEISLMPKVKLEVVVADDMVEQVVDQILKVASTGTAGDGKIFISPVEEAIRIRDGHRGEAVVQKKTDAQA